MTDSAGSNPCSIPFTKAWIDQRELEAVSQTMQLGGLGGNGPTCRLVERELEKVFQVDHALLMTSCTHALEAAVRVLELGPGDEVILPSFSFPSAGNAVLLAGARPVFAEVEPGTLNLDPDDLERRITDRTRAVIVVHYAGVSCRMDRIMELAERHRLLVIEDAAQGLDSSYQGRALGSFGEIGCISFHDTKNVSCGEGGALLTSSEQLWRRADIFREKGTNRTSFLCGEVDKYCWVGLGSSYVLSELQAAVLKVQLEKRAEILARRLSLCRRYRQGLEELERQGLVSLGQVPEDCRSNGHIFWFLLREGDRDQLLRSLKERGVGATMHFYPLHLSGMGQRLGWREGELPVTERAFRQLVRLPLFATLEHWQADYVIDTLYQLLGKASKACLST